MPDNAPPQDRPDPGPDALRRLEDRVEKASRAAERLIAEARAGARSAGRPKPPPAGWEAPRSEGESESELELLARLIQSVRELVPDDLQRRLTEALKELLLALRALIDFYLERLERREPAPAEMEDIPIR